MADENALRDPHTVAEAFAEQESLSQPPGPTPEAVAAAAAASATAVDPAVLASMGQRTRLGGAFAAVEDETSTIFRAIRQRQDRLYSHWLRKDFRARWRRRKQRERNLLDTAEVAERAGVAWDRGRPVAIALSLAQHLWVCTFPGVVIAFVILLCRKLDDDSALGWLTVFSPLMAWGALGSALLVLTMGMNLVEAHVCHHRPDTCFHGHRSVRTPIQIFLDALYSLWSDGCSFAASAIRCTCLLTVVGLGASVVVPLLKATGSLDSLAWKVALMPAPVTLCCCLVPCGFFVSKMADDSDCNVLAPPFLVLPTIISILFLLYMDGKVPNLFYVFLPFFVPLAMMWYGGKFAALFACYEEDDCSDRCWILLALMGGAVGALFVAFFLLLPIMRIEGYLDSAWTLSFIPLLIVASVFACGFFGVCVMMNLDDCGVLSGSFFEKYGRPTPPVVNVAAAARTLDGQETNVSFAV